MKKSYKRENCQSMVRAVIKDKYGRTITLTGKHAFEWNIVIESCNKLTITTFPNREKAIKRFNELKKRR